MKTEYISQEKNILEHLKNNSITPLEALNKYGCFRLSAVIYNLRMQGYKIKTTLIFKGKKHFAKYNLIKK